VRASLPENRKTSALAAPKSRQKSVFRCQRRLSGYLGAAKAVDQTSLNRIGITEKGRRTLGATFIFASQKYRAIFEEAQFLER
jgi:hypothetical protein